jgi:cystathionine gamma-synthase
MSLAESLGGVETLLAHPRTMTHAAMSPQDQERAGLGPGLLRLSVGLEALEDLSTELAAALDRTCEHLPGQVVARGAR